MKEQARESVSTLVRKKEECENRGKESNCGDKKKTSRQRKDVGSYFIGGRVHERSSPQRSALRMGT